MNKTLEKLNNQKLVKATARHLRISPRKIRLVTNLVQNMNAVEALTQLRFMHKKAAPMVARLIKSALANAKNNFSLDPENMKIVNITADMGKTMKRYFPRARGSAFVIRKKMSHINLTLAPLKVKGSGAKSKLTIFKKKDKISDSEISVEHQEAVSKKEVSESKHQFSVKTDEQKKMNKIQQKRRLFDRRAGE